MKKDKPIQLKCPYCGSEIFNRTEKARVEIFKEMTKDGETIRDEVVDDDGFTYTCLDCAKEVTEDDLVED